MVTKSIQTLTQVQARSLVERIRSHINDARALVLELHEKEGWKALGYDSWRECVVAEFEQSQAYLYRQLNAAQVERNISPIGENKPIPESVLRPLASLPPAQQREAWSAATAENPKPTAAEVEKAAAAIKSNGADPQAAEARRRENEEREARTTASNNLGMVIRILEPSQVNSVDETATALINQIDFKTLNFIAGRVSKERLLQCGRVLTQMAQLWKEANANT
jgi:hypothetical protein